MLPIDGLCGIDADLRTQLQLALASPLWKKLPYGLHVNPSAWQIQVLENWPHQRLSLRLIIPWRPAPQPNPPLVLIMKLWKACRNKRLQQHLAQLGRMLGEAKKHQPLPEPVFYDSLSQALVYPDPLSPGVLPGFEACLRDCHLA